MEDKLIKFIKNNNIQFVPGTRNYCSVPVSGYAQHLGYTDGEEVFNLINAKKRTLAIKKTKEFKSEFLRVFNYAKTNDYKAYWETERAKSEWKLE